MSYPQPVMVGKFVASKEKAPAAKARLNAHFKYIEYRKMGEHETREDRYIFSNESDHVQRKDALDDVMAHGSYNVLYHKIVLSPGEEEHIDDYRRWTRDVMRDLQQEKGIHLHWYAVVQEHERENTTTPHIHLVLAGAGEQIETEKRTTVRMDTKDYAYMREQGREHSNYEFYQELEQGLTDLNREDSTIDDHRHNELEFDRL